MKLSFIFIFVFSMASVSGSYARKYEMKYIDSTASEPDTAAADTTKSAKYRYIDISAEYGSNFTYRHQIDETPTQAPYIMPTVFYHAKSGFWASVGSYRLLKNYQETQPNGKDTSIAPAWIETDFNVGWDVKIHKNTDISASYMFSIFDRKISLVAQALANTFEAYAGHDFKYIYSGLRYDFTYQNFTATINHKKQDFPVHDHFLMWENSHEWFLDDVFIKEDEFDINPMFTIMAGTDNFIGKFITARYPTSQKAKDYAAIASKFLIQQFVLSLPVAYTVGDFTFTPTFEYTILTQKKTETSPTSYPIYRFSAAYRFNFDK